MPKLDDHCQATLRIRSEVYQQTCYPIASYDPLLTVVTALYTGRRQPYSQYCSAEQVRLGKGSATAPHILQRTAVGNAGNSTRDLWGPSISLFSESFQLSSSTTGGTIYLQGRKRHTIQLTPSTPELYPRLYERTFDESTMSILDNSGSVVANVRPHSRAD